MRFEDPCKRWSVGALLVLALCFAHASTSSAQRADAFVWSGKPIHPACVHALVMETGERIPVIAGVNVQGCMSSPRSKATPEWGPRSVYWFSDDAVLGGGRFGYKVMSTLDNGLFIVAMARETADGTENVSLAAIDLVTRPTLFGGEVNERIMLEMVGEVWIQNVQLASLRTNGNIVHFASGAGPNRQENTVDLTRIGRARNRQK